MTRAVADGRTARGRCLLLSAALVVCAACVPPRGGWDAAALFESRPDLAAIPGQRLSDLTPYPALPTDAGEGGPDRVWLVACRYPPDERVELRIEGEAFPDAWADAAIHALAPDRFGVALELVPPAPSFSRAAHVGVVSIADGEARGPVGLGDTLTLCDVSRSADGVPRGELVSGRIRLRRRLMQPTGVVYEAAGEEWVAAFLHELAHALGFAGHAASGDSPVHLEQSALRAMGRRALAGAVLPAPNLHALHGLAPGHRLGTRALDPQSAAVVERVRRAVDERSARVGPGEGPLASVGDSEARLAWRWPDGFVFDVRFPRYVEELRRGAPITAEPGERTRRAWRARSGR